MGIYKAVAAASTDTEYQRCIVYRVRNTPRYLAEKAKKAFTTNPQTIYHSLSEQTKFKRTETFADKWRDKYSNPMKNWAANWDVICLIFKFLANVRKVICMTNAIESLNSTYRRLNL